MFSQFLCYTLWIGTWFVNFVDCNNNWHTSSFRVIDCFNCLWHYTIISSNYKDCNICDRSTTSTHRSEGFVTWCIKECNFLTICFDLVSTNMLSDTTCFTLSHTRFAETVKQGCFTMVNVSHNCYNGWTFNHVFFFKIAIFNKQTFNI